jgi:Tol biopolymer transport system component
MRRLFLTALLLVVGLGARAQAYDPAVSYTTLAGNSSVIVLTNQDGSKPVTVFSSKRALSGVNFAPGGGRIAFSEQGVLRLLTYSASNSGVSVSSVLTLDSSPGGAAAPDFSPDGSRVLYVGNVFGTPEIRVIPSTGGAYTVVLPNMSGVRRVAWLRSGTSFVYLRQFQSDLRVEVRRVDLDPFDGVIGDSGVLTTDDGLFREIADIDSARTRNAMLVVLNYPTDIRIVELNFDTAQFTDLLSGSLARYTSSDGRIVYRERSGNYLSRYDLASGTSIRLTKRGGYASIDARP